MTLLEAWKCYEQDKHLLGYSTATLKSYLLQIQLLVKDIGNIEIADVTYEIIKGYLAKQTHLKPASLGHRIRFVRSFFHWARDEGYISKNPVAKLKEPKASQRVPKALSEEDTEMLREGCKTSLEHALIEFLYSTGCRIGEVYRLNRNAIDWENRSCIVRGKGDKEREVYFTVKCRIWLKKYLSERKDFDMALFVTERKPHRMSISELRYVVKRVAKRSGIEANVYPHILRHTYATHLLNNGTPLEVIQSFMGHAKLETTRIYCSLSGERRKELYRRYF